MKARDVMTTAVHTVGPDASVTDIAQLLLDRRISGVPVVDAAGHVLGVVSEGDLMRRPESGTIARRSWWLALVASNDELARDYVKTHGTKARDVMSRPAVTIDAGAELAAVAALLEKRRIKRLPVLQDGKLVGIVTRSNLLHGLIAHRAGSPAKSDADIRKQIENELEGEAWANLRTTNVVVMDGVAHLWSMVGSESERHALIVAAERIPGVQRVEEHIADGLRFNLTAEGHEATVAADGERALALLLEERRPFDVIILDVMLPTKDGFTVATELRGAGLFTPILMLTARNRAEDVLRGFESGADDYLPKPFEPRELLARIRAILRRRTEPVAEAAADKSVLQFGSLRIDRDARVVSVAEQPCTLTSYQFDLLVALAERAGRVLTRDQIMEAVRGRELDAFDRSIDVHMGRIRAAIEADPKDPKRILKIGRAHV